MYSTRTQMNKMRREFSNGHSTRRLFFFTASRSNWKSECWCLEYYSQTLFLKCGSFLMLRKCLLTRRVEAKIILSYDII